MTALPRANGSGLHQLAKALDYAARQHVAQRRKGALGEPYINHLCEVAALLAETSDQEDADLLSAAVLHDVVEDTDATIEDVRALFGAEVARIVAEVTDDTSLPRSVRKARQIEKAPNLSQQGRMLKIADKTSNLRAIVASPPEDWSDDRKREYVRWAEEVVAGCRGLNHRLEAEFDTAAAEAKRLLNTNTG